MYSVDWGPILPEAKSWSLILRTQFYSLVEKMAANPNASGLGVRPLKLGTHPPGGWYSAPFDRALLIFQMMADFPLIRLLYVTWLDGGPPG